jgi:hypothetical protein
MGLFVSKQSIPKKIGCFFITDILTTSILLYIYQLYIQELLL